MRCRAVASLLLAVVLVLCSCGDEGLALFPRAEASELSIVGPENGQVFTGTQPLALRIAAADPVGDADLEVQVTLVSSSGTRVWEQRIAGPAVNEDLGLQLPDLAAGEYQLEITVFQDGEQVERSVTTIFSVRTRPRVVGITSFPPLITASSPVLLSADISADDGSDPWLRWTWRGKTIAQGGASSGTNAVLWTAPPDDGVYTVTLELFPVAPAAGSGFPFRSSIAMSTDIYVSAAGAAARDELGPAASYLSLFHLQADLADAAAATRDVKRTAVAIGSLRIVPVGDGFGYRLGDGAGFRIPWPMLPVDDGDLAPFTLSVGIRPERFTGADRLVAAAAGDLALTLGLGTDASPELAIAVPSSPTIPIPAGAASLEPGRRSLVSVSVAPRADGLVVRWFLDGRQVSETFVGVLLPRLGAEGSAVVGGTSGFTGVIDELGVYVRDPAGRPAIDPTLFETALRKLHGERVLAAEGFDGMFLPAGWTASGKTAMSAGRLELAPEGSIELPPLRYPDEGGVIEIVLGDGSERAASVRLAWAGSDAPFLEDRLVAESGVVRLQLAGETVTARTTGGLRSWTIPKAPAEKAGLALRVACPREARSPLAVEEILALATADHD